MMKKILLTTAALMTVSTMAFADTTQDNFAGTNTHNEYAATDTGNTHITNADGSGDTIISETTVESYKPLGYVSNSNLTTSGTDTCFGSNTAGISGPGFGISGGSTFVDENCVMMKQSKLLASLGLKDAAVLLLMQQDKEIAEAVFGAYPELAATLTSVK